MRKGSISGILPMIGLLLMTALMMFQSIPISQSFSNEVANSINDLTRMSATRSYGDFYYYSYLPTAGVHSTHQKTWDLGQKGGGEDLRWRYDTLSTITAEKLIKNLRYRTNETFRAEYAKIFETNIPGFSNCKVPGDMALKSIPYDDLSLYYSGKKPRERTNIPLSLSSSFVFNYFGITYRFGKEAVGIKCTFSEKTFRYKGDPQNIYQTRRVAYDNRYMMLANQTHDAVRELRENLRDVPTDYSASGETCRYPSDSEIENVEEKAIGDAQNEIGEAMSEVRSKFPEKKGFEIPTLEVEGPSETLRYAETDDFALSSGDVDVTKTGRVCDRECIERDKKGNCIEVDKDYYHEIDVDMSIKSSNFRIVYQDQKYRIPTAEGWKHLKFVVDPYFHDYTQD
ncbi:MAG: hypothetical protein ABEK01_03595 [Candidatus Nanohaloarchaea archaeon]